MTVSIHKLEVGKTYQHYKNKRFVIRVIDRFVTEKGEHLILEHPWVKDWHVCLTRTYESSKWMEVASI